MKRGGWRGLPQDCSASGGCLGVRSRVHTGISAYFASRHPFGEAAFSVVHPARRGVLCVLCGEIRVLSAEDHQRLTAGYVQVGAMLWTLMTKWESFA